MIRFDPSKPCCPNCASTTNWLLFPHRLFYIFTCLVCHFEETFLLDEISIASANREDEEVLEGAA